METYIPPPPPLILVVDDIVEIRDLVQFLLEERGVRVCTAPDGAAALSAVEQLKPDAVVLDLGMPGLDGCEVIQRLRSEGRLRGVPIVALSGMRRGEEALAAGADAYMEKPCAPDRLLAELLRLMLRPASGI
jgi:CheY-like chemotaxis protein